VVGGARKEWNVVVALIGPAYGGAIPDEGSKSCKGDDGFPILVAVLHIGRPGPQLLAMLGPDNFTLVLVWANACTPAILRFAMRAQYSCGMLGIMVAARMQ